MLPFSESDKKMAKLPKNWQNISFGLKKHGLGLVGLWVVQQYTYNIQYIMNCAASF